MSSWTNWPVDFTLSQEALFSSDFPSLQPDKCVGNLSRATRLYNCFAWAAVFDDVRWEPDQNGQYYWPENVPRELTVEACKQAYQTVGFEECSDGFPEPGIEKIAIYANFGEITHAARQLENGNWTTKFGDFEDVEHVDLDCLIGPLYGNVEAYMKRQRV